MITLNKLLKLSGVLSVSNQSEDIKLKFTTDSRNIRDENVFVAIKGEKFDGFDYAESVLEKGCRVIIFQSTELNKERSQKLKNTHSQCCFIEVKDVIDFLHKIANAISNEFYLRNRKIICISGSNGKTTTKEMVAFLLEKLNFKVIKTLRNNNNHIGVPLTLFQINDETEFAVVELGSNHPGEIPKLCEILDPHIGYTTNIGHTHLEFFDNLENVFKEEAFLNTAIKNSGKTPKLFLVNNYDSYLKNIDGPECIQLNCSDITVKADFNKCRLCIEGNNYEVSNPNLTGKHNFFNIGAAIILVHKVTGKSIEQIVEVSKNFQPTNNRSQWLDLTNGSRVFLDAYNANPSSMKEAIEGFNFVVGSQGIPSSEVLYILGDMNELGSSAESFHTQLGEYLTTIEISNLWAVGRFAKNYQKGFPAARMFSETSEAKRALDQELSQFKYVFIKGSRSLQLESIIDIT